MKPLETKNNSKYFTTMRQKILLVAAVIMRCYLVDSSAYT
jgi:hypothetical protein